MTDDDMLSFWREHRWPLTEAEWYACRDAGTLLHFFSWEQTPDFDLLDTWRLSDRKLRLIAVACCRRLWSWLWVDEYRQLVEASERFAEGVGTCDALADAERKASRDNVDFWPWCIPDHDLPAGVDAISVQAATHDAAEWVGSPIASEAAVMTIYCLGKMAKTKCGGLAPHIQASLCEIVRDISGDPFRPVTVDPSWLTSDVVALATGIYEERAFDRLPILADALQEAGCDSDDLLNHLRDPNATHVRGCWALDLVLCKS